MCGPWWLYSLHTVYISLLSLRLLHTSTGRVLCLPCNSHRMPTFHGLFTISANHLSSVACLMVCTYLLLQYLCSKHFILQDSIAKCGQLARTLEKIRHNEGQLKEYYCAPNETLETILETLCKAINDFQTAIVVRTCKMIYFAERLKWIFELNSVYLQDFLLEEVSKYF